MLVTRFNWVFSIFITSTKLKTFKLVLTYTKNVREPWLNNANFKKESKKFLIFVMFTLAWLLWQYNRCFVLLLDSWTCLGSMVKTRHEQQKESNYSKNKPFSKSSNYFWNACKELSKRLIFRVVIRKCS